MKKIITLSTIAFLSTALYASTDDMQTQIDELTAKIAKLEKTQKKQNKKISAVNKLANKDNIKFDVDFRTSYDNISYKTVGGQEYNNDSLYSNRLWLNMGYAPTDTILFKGQLAFNKAFGATAFNMANSNPQRGYGFDAFDWVINENLTDDSLKVREAYWLWTPTIGGFKTTWSVGRRPATNGYLINLRDDDKAKSPMGHIINMEFDGASASIKLDRYVPGMYAKVCLGRGLTNANARFTTNQANASIDYATDTTTYADGNKNLDNVDMVGVILKAYDDGQYSVMAKWYRGFDVPGMYATSMTDMDSDPATQRDLMPTDYKMLTGGDMDGAAISAKIEGIGDEINDFLDETIVFASFAWSKSNPNSDIQRTVTAADGSWSGTQNTGSSMLGSSDSETGTSYWFGTQMPNMTGGKFGLEYNHGSQYWRPFTYGEDTMIGSKMAVRGSAYEAYWTQPLIDNIFSMQIRYTYLDYDYTGSNAFFGDGGTAIKLSDAQALGMDPVETASDLRIYFRYQY